MTASTFDVVQRRFVLRHPLPAEVADIVICPVLTEPFVPGGDPRPGDFAVLELAFHFFLALRVIETLPRQMFDTPTILTGLALTVRPEKALVRVMA